MTKNVITESGVSCWCLMFEDGRSNFYDEYQGGRPSGIMVLPLFQFNEL